MRGFRRFILFGICMFNKLFKRKEDVADPGVSIFPDGDQVMLSEGSTGDGLPPAKTAASASGAALTMLLRYAASSSSRWASARSRLSAR